MKRPEFEAFALRLQSDAFTVLAGKGKDYARNDNAFHNFETTAEFLGIEREAVLAAHLYKHFAAIFAYIREGQTETEPIRGRIIDAINYLTFLAAMVYDSAPQEEPLSGWKREEAVDLAPGRALDEQLPLFTHNHTGPPWYLPANVKLGFNDEED